MMQAAANVPFEENRDWLLSPGIRSIGLAEDWINCLVSSLDGGPCKEKVTPKQLYSLLPNAKRRGVQDPFVAPWRPGVPQRHLES